jgi:predicted phage terminase large subunit-like protein
VKSYAETIAFYKRVIADGDVGVQRLLCLRDRYFLLTQALGVRVALHPWVYERCREVEADPDGYLDLWSRGHFKSTIITYAGVVQEILRNPEICVCVMSYKRGAANAFLSQIKTAFETSDILLACFPDILFPERKDHTGDRWSVEGGICVKRTATRKEATVQASGLVEGQLTGGHFDLLVYDDVVTLESVYTPEQAQRTTDAWSMSLNLGTENSRHWYIGTRYALYDTYDYMLKHGIKERRHLAIDENGEPVYWSKKELEERKAHMTTKDWASQILQAPTGEGELVFRPEWLQRYHHQPERNALNVYIIIDSANAKRIAKGGSDFTVMEVWGLGRDHNYYLLDAVRERLSLAERTAKLFELVERWRPSGVFWEQVGAMSDVAHVKEKQDQTGWHFAITELHQTVPKEDRIHWLEPLYRNGRIWMPFQLWRRSVTGEAYDFMELFEREEFLPFPSVTHDDMLDCAANLQHPTFTAAAAFPVAPLPPNLPAGTGERYDTNWMPDGW